MWLCVYQFSNSGVGNSDNNNVESVVGVPGELLFNKIISDRWKRKSYILCTL